MNFKTESQKLANKSIKNLNDYQSKTFRRIISDLEQKYQKNNDNIKQELFDKYRKSFDLHMFGMAIFHAVYIFDLDSKWIDEYAIPFTNLDPALETDNNKYLTETFESINKLITELPSYNASSSKVSSRGIWLSPGKYSNDPKQ